MTAGSGLSSASIGDIEKIFRSLIKSPAPIKVFLFGSRSRGDHQKYSDVDLLVEGPADAIQLRAVKDALADSNLPYKFDVVAKDEVYDNYRRQIESEKKFLFELPA